MTENEDRVYVRRCLQGERQAFEFIVRKYQSSLVNYFFRMIQERELSLEMTQEVFLRAYANLHTYKDNFQFSTWLFRIASNLLIDYWRKKKIPLVFLDAQGEDEQYAPVQLSDHEPSVAEQYERKMAMETITQALARLPENLRELFILRHINDFSYEEIAGIKNLPVGTVKNRVFQAKELLRQLMEEA
ncbi:MAG: sigma-70 family RNA polymerase sigma factor [Candidatus Aminicenantes bacterium]|nr:sigma-70 family RNA polymerase sigma factor [Candidatus Aminicenantes bacterium]